MLGNVIVVISIPLLLLGKRSAAKKTRQTEDKLGHSHTWKDSRLSSFSEVCCIPGSALKDVGDVSRRCALSRSSLGSVLTQVSPKVAEGEGRKRLILEPSQDWS